MTALPHIQYFLGANSPTGFYSLYDHLLPPEEARAIYILKGGPGCGKSTLMRKIGAWAEESGLETEYIICSGDPDSLDAVLLPKLGVAIVDGTAPHVVVSLGHFWDKLSEHKAQLCQIPETGKNVLDVFLILILNKE